MSLFRRCIFSSCQIISWLPRFRLSFQVVQGVPWCGLKWLEAFISHVYKINHNEKRWRMYILPECIAVGNRFKKRMDVFWRTGFKQDVNLFVVLKFLIIRWFRVIFIQSLTLNARNAFWQNVHTAIFFVMCLQSFSVNCVYLRIALVLHAMAEKRVQDCIAMVLITPCNILHVTSNYRG